MSLDVESVQAWVDKYGKRHSRAREVLSKLIPGIIATLGSEIGKEILKDDMDRYGQLLDKAGMAALSQDEAVEYTYLRKRLTGLVGKINQFLRLQSDLQDK